MTDRIQPETDLLWEEFHHVVNMSAQELRTWLLTEASGEDAFASDPDLRLPKLGREVVRILAKRKVDLTEQDVEAMRQVVDYVDERLAAPPPGGVRDEGWRRSLMTVGHDPLKPR